MKDIVLSGIRPTGRLHIGNYLGSVKNFIELQKTRECYFFVADLHSLNEKFDPKTKRNQVLGVAADYLAAGLDPEKCVIFVQSTLHEHAELAIILSNFIPAPYLFRMTQYKDKALEREGESINAGLLYYPVLMASDILIYKSTLVPVGQDQTQHVELARDVARIFNNSFGNIFPEPKPLYTETPKIMSLLKPDKKMSKTLGDANCIYIDDEPQAIAKKISRAVTDTGDGKSIGAQNLFDLIKIFSPEKIYEKFSAEKKSGRLKYSELKKALAGDIAKYFDDFRKKKAELLKNPQILEKILADGAKKARLTAAKTLQEVKKKIGILY